MKKVETQTHVFTKHHGREERTLALNKLFNPTLQMSNSELLKRLTIDYLHTGYYPFKPDPILTTYVTYGAYEELL